MPSLDTEMLNEIRLSRKALQDSVPSAEADLSLITSFHTGANPTYTGSGQIYDIRVKGYNTSSITGIVRLLVDSNLIPWDYVQGYYDQNYWAYLFLNNYSFSTNIVFNSACTNGYMMLRLRA